MRWMKWVGLAAAFALVISCFNTWVIVHSRNIIAKGIDAAAMGMGKPGYLHIGFTFIFILFTFIPKIWAKRFNVLVTALNLAWAARNYFVVSACNWGECPEKHISIYLLMPFSLLMLVSALLPDIKMDTKNAEQK